MKVIWLCNIILPDVSMQIGETIIPYGGWLTGAINKIVKEEDIELCVVFPYVKQVKQNRLGKICEKVKRKIVNNQESKIVLEGSTKNYQFIGFEEKYNSMSIFDTIIKRYNPDIIHIWGSEYKHSYDMVMASKKNALIDNTVLSTQGIVSFCCNYFYDGLSQNVINGKTLGDIIHNRKSIKEQAESFYNNGKYEQMAFKELKHIIGRTDWDKACTSQINPNAIYYHCNEIMRESFYNNKWNYERCKKNTVFISQCSYTIKGLHFALQALNILKERIPDIHFNVSGSTSINKKGLQLNRYDKYISEYIKNHNLEKHITFLGQLNEEDMCKQFLSTNLFLSPSNMENSSNSIAEAMLLGVPIVASEVGGTSSIITHKKEGLLYQHNSIELLSFYILSLLNDYEMAKELCENVRLKASNKFNKDINTKRMLDIYECLCKKNTINNLYNKEKI